VAEVICTFSGTESGNQFSDPAAEIGNRSLGSLAQKGFQFARASEQDSCVLLRGWPVRLYRGVGIKGRRERLIAAVEIVAGLARTIHLRRTLHALREVLDFEVDSQVFVIHRYSPL
jgi:hypothetical protein